MKSEANLSGPGRDRLDHSTKMKLLERRTPPGWPLIFVAIVCAVLLAAALYSGDAFVPGRRGEASRHFLRATQPERYFHYVRFYSVATVLGFFFGFMRVVPIENAVRSFVVRAKEQIRRKGYDRGPAPWWGYLILAGFIALVIWVGKVTMYAE